MKTTASSQKNNSNRLVEMKSMTLTRMIPIILYRIFQMTHLMNNRSWSFLKLNKNKKGVYKFSKSHKGRLLCSRIKRNR